MADKGQSSPNADKSVQDLRNEMSEMGLLSFRKIDDVKKLARHFQWIISHPHSQRPVILQYLKNLDDMNKHNYVMKRDGVDVEYIFAPEIKSSLQRQRFNSLPVSEVSELLKTEFPTTENAEQVHICIDCNIAMELNDQEPLMESLQKHFNLDIHLPKFKRESVDVKEPIVLPNMSRRLSAMESGDSSAEIAQVVKPNEKVDRLYIAKMEASLIRHLPDNSESVVSNAMKFFNEVYEKLCSEIGNVDFTTLTASVAPIIMSIKDNVNQNFATDANKNFENDESEVPEKPVKSQFKKHKYYGPIENVILELLTNHKLLPLIDDRTGKPAFFCVSCEYYTLRFRYDSVLNHVFSSTHLINLSSILQADKHIPFVTVERTIEKVKEINWKFLQYNSISEDDDALYCGLCKINIPTFEASIIHVLEENHLSKLSNKIYRKFKTEYPIASIPEEWGQKNLDWGKYLAGTGKLLPSKDYVIIENFIKPMSKIAHFCPCCDATLKGPRQILFNHVRQKKHLRSSAPYKLTALYKNYARPLEYYAGFGNYFVCTICPSYIVQPSFAGMIEHFDSELHVETIAKFISNALFPDNVRHEHLFALNRINLKELSCGFCDASFQDMHDTVLHILSSTAHHNALAETKYQLYKGDIISVYMKGNYVLHSEGTVFTCKLCKSLFNSLRAILNHLIYADHFPEKLSYENIFRFYLELKHNMNMLVRNKYIYAEFGKLICGVCDVAIQESENAKRHVANPRHKENMGANYINLSLDMSANE